MAESSPATKPSKSVTSSPQPATVLPIDSVSQSPPLNTDLATDWNRSLDKLSTPPPANKGAFEHGITWIFVALFFAALYAIVRPSETVKNTSRSRVPPSGTPPSNDEKKPEPAIQVAKPNWWDVLGIPRAATIQEIRRAFREKMSEYHPDKVASLGKEIRELAERKSKEINAAYRDALFANGVEK